MIKITIISHDDITLPNERFDGKGGHIGAMQFYNNQQKEIKQMLKKHIIENWNSLKIDYEISGIKKVDNYAEWEEEIKKNIKWYISNLLTLKFNIKKI